jgi:hypothetical protein
MGEGTSPYAVGEVWHYFDRELHYPLTLLTTGDFPNVTLSDFDVIVMTNGQYSRLLTDGTLGKLKSWIQAGGKLIAIEGAAAALAGKEGFELKRKEDDKKKDDKKNPEEDLKAYGARERESVSGDTPGAIYRLTLDNSHPLAYGLPNYYHGLILSSNDYAFLKTAGT